MKNHQNPQEHSGSERGAAVRAGKFLLGKGFYIVLLLCLAAIGVSGYVVFSSAQQNVNTDFPEIPDLGLSSTVPYSGVSLATTPPVTEAVNVVGTQATIPDVTAPIQTQAPSTLKPSTTVAKVFYVRPLVGTVIREYSDSTPVYNPTMDDWRVHTGVDIAAALGEVVCAVAPGTVTALYNDYFTGVTVEILHLDGVTSRYCGLAENTDVVVGDPVTAGTVIGCVGETAIFESLDGPHLHFELCQNDETIDPNRYLPAP